MWIPCVPLKLTYYKTEEFPDLLTLQQEYARKQGLLSKEHKKQLLVKEAEEKQRRIAEAEMRSYTSVFDNASMLSNTLMNGGVTDDAAKDFEDDFM